MSVYIVIRNVGQKHCYADKYCFYANTCFVYIDNKVSKNIPPSAIRKADSVKDSLCLHLTTQISVDSVN